MKIIGDVSMRRIACAFMFASLLLMSSVTLSQAGGWAVVTLDQLPKEVVAGKPLTISFTVRQHGRTLINGLKPKILATRTEPLDSVTIIARPLSDKTGHYEAALTLPTAGAWKWSIDAFGAFPQPMPTLNVLASAPAKNTSSDSTRSSVTTSASSISVSMPSALPLIVGLVGLLGTVALLFFWQRTQARAAFVLSIVAVLVSMFAFALAGQPSVPSALARLQVSGAQPGLSAADEASVSATQYGKDLFLAKGCVVCHAHATVSAERASANLANFSVGPVLTNLTRDSEYLHRWLKDPSAVKPGTEMPTLGLNPDEIDALVVFLSTKPAQ